MRLGLFGCGAVGAKRATALGRHRLAMVHDSDIGRAEALAARHGSETASSVEQMLAAKLDALVIATPPSAHLALAEQALAHGIPVLVEKPAGRSLAEAEAIAAAAARSGRVAKVGFNHRFHPALTESKGIVAGGTLGPPLFIRAHYGHGGRPGYEREWRFDPTCSGGGETVDQGGHLIDLARWFMGELSLSYAATPTYYWPGTVEDNCFLALRGALGRMAWLHASWTEWKNGFRFEIACRDGTIVIDGLGGSYGAETLTVHRMRPEMGPPDTDRRVFDGPDHSWMRELEAFANSIAGETTEIADITDAVAIWRVIAAAYASDRG